MILAIGETPAGCYVQLRVGEDESRSSTTEKRWVVEGFSELGERFTGFDYHTTGVILSFWVGVDGELGRLAVLCGIRCRERQGWKVQVVCEECRDGEKVERWL